MFQIVSVDCLMQSLLHNEKHSLDMFYLCFLGLDNSGLSDPFAKIYICDQSRATQVKYNIVPDFMPCSWRPGVQLDLSQVIDETLSPTWDELLVFPRLMVHGRREDIKRTPPLVTIEIYDYDKVTTMKHETRIIVDFSSIKLSSSEEHSPLQQ